MLLQMKAQRITTADVVRELRRPDMQAAILSGRPLKAVTAGVIRHGLDAQVCSHSKLLLAFVATRGVWLSGTRPA